MEEIFRLLEEEQIHKAIEYIYEKLKEKDSKGEFVEDLINHLNKLNKKSEIIIKTIFPSLLRLIGIENDVLRYSLFIYMKSSLRFFSNVFLPIGLILLLNVIDYVFLNWIINSIYLFLIMAIAYLRWRIAFIDNRRIFSRSP